MKSLIFGLLIVSKLTAMAASEAPDPDAWIPTTDQIARVETKLGNLKRYTRYYEGIVVSGHKQIVGFFILDGGDLNIHPTDKLSSVYVFDGGYKYLHVHYDIETDKIIGVYHGGR